MSKLCSKDGLKCCSSAKKKIDAHGKSPSHGLASNKSYAFQLTRKGPSKAVNVRWNKTGADRIKKNRSRLITIIECVIFLAKQGLSFRGHREDEEYLLNPNNNPGNFKALLQLLRTLGTEDICISCRSCTTKCYIHIENYIQTDHRCSWWICNRETGGRCEKCKVL